MNCDICFQAFDHSIRKPYSISSCPHTYCSECVHKFKQCPQCAKLINEINLNLALLKLIPESSFDKLKRETLKAYIELNEIRGNLKNEREHELNMYTSKIASIKKVITNETNKLINILKIN